MVDQDIEQLLCERTSKELILKTMSAAARSYIGGCFQIDWSSSPKAEQYSALYSTTSHSLFATHSAFVYDAYLLQKWFGTV